MEQLFSQLPPVVSIGISVFLLLTVILWAFLPFAVFGLKSRLDKLITINRGTNKWLREIAEADKELEENPQEAS